MDLKMILSVLAIAVFGFVGIMLLIPENIDDEVQRLPWLVEQDQNGRTRVFGFIIGETALGEIRSVFKEEGEINLFTRLGAGGDAAGYAAEAYFQQIYLNRLRGDFVFSLNADDRLLAPMYERGLRISQASSGAKKVKLDPADVETLLSMPIRSITYLPWKSLDSDVIQHRFGSPADKLSEPETGVTHWLYPDKGMDVAIDADGGVVIQYVNRDAFAQILAPLDEVSKDLRRDTGGAAAATIPLDTEKSADDLQPVAAPGD